MSNIFEKDPEPVFKARPKRILNIRALYAGAAVIAAVVILVLCMTVFFNVSDIEIEGVSLYTQEQIVNVGGITQNMNLVRTDVSLAEQRLKENLVYIDDAKVTKSYPSTVVISCTEAVKAADIEYEGSYYVVSTSGRILEAANAQPTGGIPVVTGFKFYTGQDLIDKGKELTEEDILAFRAAGSKLRSEDDYSSKILVDLVNEIRKQELKNVVSIEMSSRADIKLNVDNRLEVKLGSSADIPYKLSYFNAVISTLAPNYEGTLIYNGVSGGVSAIPKDKAIGKPNFAKDPVKKDDSSSEAEPANAPMNGTGDNNSVPDQAADTQQTQQDGALQGNNGQTDGTGYDNGWTDNGWTDNGGQADNGGWTDDTWTDNTWDGGGNDWDTGYTYW